MFENLNQDLGKKKHKARIASSKIKAKQNIQKYIAVLKSFAPDWGQCVCRCELLCLPMVIVFLFSELTHCPQQFF